MKAAKKEISISNFKDQLENIGFNAEPQLAFFSGDQKKEVNRKPAFAEPVEIPVSLEQPISIKEAREAVAYCMGSGMEDRNVRPATIVGQIILPQLRKLPKSIFEEDKLKFSDSYSARNFVDTNTYFCSGVYEEKANPSLNAMKYSCTFESKVQINGGSKTMNHIGDLHIGIDKSLGWGYGNKSENDIFLSFPDRNGKLVSVPGASLSTSLPRVNYQVKEGEKLLTEWGLTNEQMLLDRFSITMERDQYNGKPMSLVNRKTNATLPIKIDTRAYAECLRDSIHQKSKLKKLYEERELAREVNRGKALKFAPNESKSEDSNGSSSANEVK